MLEAVGGNNMGVSGGSVSSKYRGAAAAGRRGALQRRAPRGGYRRQDAEVGAEAGAGGAERAFSDQQARVVLHCGEF